MVKNLNLIANSTASPSVRPFIHQAGADTPWCRNVLVPKRLGPNRQNAIAVVEIHSSRTKESCPSHCLALNVLACEYSGLLNRTALDSL